MGADSSFVKRPAPKKRPAPRDTAGYQPTEMGTGYERARNLGVGVVPGSQKIESSGIGNPFKQIADFYKKITSYNPYAKKGK